MAYHVPLEEELKRNKEARMEDLQALKNWYSLQAHLPSVEDELLFNFYHSCWYKMEPTKTTVDNYFTLRTHATELFSDKDPFTVNIRKGKPVAHYFFLNERTPNNHRVNWMKLLNTDPSDYVFSESAKAFAMHYDLELYLNGSAPGDVIVFDMEGVSLGHLARLNLTAAKRILLYIQEAFPVRIINLHFINVVPFMDKIMALLRPFMHKEFVDKFKFHTEGLDSIFEFVPKKIMPKDYGGEDKSVMELTEERLQALQKHKSWFSEGEKLRCDESKRPEKSKIRNDAFGLEGSFKKLDFD